VKFSVCNILQITVATKNNFANHLRFTNHYFVLTRDIILAALGYFQFSIMPRARGSTSEAREMPGKRNCDG